MQQQPFAEKFSACHSSVMGKIFGALSFGEVFFSLSSHVFTQQQTSAVYAVEILCIPTSLDIHFKKYKIPQLESGLYFLTPKIHSYRVDFLKPKSTQLKSRLINSKVLLNQSFHSSELVGTHCMQYYKEGAWVAWAWKTEVHFMAGASSFTKGCAHY